METGFYWVRTRGDRVVVAHRTKDGRWSLPGNAISYHQDEVIDEILSDRLLPPRE